MGGGSGVGFPTLGKNPEGTLGNKHVETSALKNESVKGAV